MVNKFRMYINFILQGGCKLLAIAKQSTPGCPAWRYRTPERTYGFC